MVASPAVHCSRAIALHGNGSSLAWSAAPPPRSSETHNAKALIGFHVEQTWPFRSPYIALPLFCRVICARHLHTKRDANLMRSFEFVLRGIYVWTLVVSSEVFAVSRDGSRPTVGLPRRAIFADKKKKKRPRAAWIKLYWSYEHRGQTS